MILIWSFALALSGAAGWAGETEVVRLLETRECEGCDLAGADLSGANLMGGSLKGANLNGARLEGTRLADMQLVGVDFSGADLTGAILNNADARGALFKGADLSNARLIETDFGGADLSSAVLAGSQIRDANFSRAVLDQVNMTGASVSGWKDEGALFCATIDPAGVSLDRDCQKVNEARELMAAGFGGGRDLLRGPTPGVEPVAPGDGEAALDEYLSNKPWPRANSHGGVLQIQTMLRSLGYDPGPSDGYWGAGTREALNDFLESRGIAAARGGQESHLEALRAALSERGWTTLPRVDWDWRSTTIKIGPTHILGDSETVTAIPDFGLNTVTIDFNCFGFIETDDPEAPIARRTGCGIGNVAIPVASGGETVNMAKSARAAELARKAGLQVHVKMLAKMEWENFGLGEVPVEMFFKGDGHSYSGYSATVLQVAKLAEELGAEYFTIGAEFGNMNARIESDPRWPKLIEEIRGRFSGKLKYDFNFRTEGNPFSQTGKNDVMSLVDVLGINVFPTQLFAGRVDYTAEEVALAYERARNRTTGRNYMQSIRDFVARYDVPVILGEAHFPTWEGSADFPFRGTCDLDGFGRKDWQYTKGPLRAKRPSDEAGRVLAEAYLLVFADEEWVSGIDYLYWTTGTYYQTFKGEKLADPAEWVDCASMLYQKPNGIKEMIREFHGGG